jgi:tRNA-2-methylthio-N6-dimethylallyladenosine synthase
MSPALIAAVATLPKACPEISLPVQAGHDALLRRMGRPYKMADYRRLVKGIRTAIPDVAISTDVIVGFPGETTEEYQGTRSLLEEERFDVVHTAAYSPRPGTAAARLPDDVPPAVKQARRKELEEIQTRISTELNAAFLGQEVEILVEGRHKGRWRGRIPQGKWTFFDDPEDWKGRIAQLRIAHTGAWSLRGAVVSKRGAQ